MAEMCCEHECRRCYTYMRSSGRRAEVKRRWSMPSKRRIQGNTAMNASASWAFKHYLRRMTKSIVLTIRVKIESSGNSMRGAVFQ